MPIRFFLLYFTSSNRQYTKKEKWTDCLRQVQLLRVMWYAFLLSDADGLSSLGKKTIECERMRLLTQMYCYLSAERGRDAQTIFSNLLMMSATLSVREEAFTRDLQFIRRNEKLESLVCWNWSSFREALNSVEHVPYFRKQRHSSSEYLTSIIFLIELMIW